MKFCKETVDARLRAYASQPRKPGDRTTIENLTGWSTLDLRRVIEVVHRTLGVSSRRSIRLAYHTGGDHGLTLGGNLGSAWVGGRALQLALPVPAEHRQTGRSIGKVAARVYGRDLDRLDGRVLADLAAVLAHEIEHNLGLRHAQMEGGGTLVPGVGYDRVRRAVAELVVRRKQDVRLQPVEGQ